MKTIVSAIIFLILATNFAIAQNKLDNANFKLEFDNLSVKEILNKDLEALYLSNECYSDSLVIEIFFKDEIIASFPPNHNNYIDLSKFHERKTEILFYEKSKKLLKIKFFTK